MTINGFMGLREKVIDYARDKNDYFCIHDLAGFYDMESMNNLSAMLSVLKSEKVLIKTDVTKDCKMQSKAHNFWIYNKPNSAMQAIQNLSKKTEEPSLTEKVLEYAKNMKGYFCWHDITNYMNTQNPKSLAVIISRLVKQRKLIKHPEKRACNKQDMKHDSWILKHIATRERKTPRTKSLLTDDFVKVAKTHPDEEFCIHAIQKRMGYSYGTSANILHHIKNKVIYVGKKKCDASPISHRFYRIRQRLRVSPEERKKRVLKSLNLKEKKIIPIHSVERKYIRWDKRLPELKRLFKEGKTDVQIANAFGCSVRRIENIRQRNRLLRKPHTGEPKTIARRKSIEDYAHNEIQKRLDESAKLPESRMIPLTFVPPKTHERIEICPCCGKRKMIIEIHLE